MAATDLTDAERGYLETLYWLYEADLPMTAANVARAMQLSAPAVHEMIGRLEREGYITRSDDKVIVAVRSAARTTISSVPELDTMPSSPGSRPVARR